MTYLILSIKTKATLVLEILHNIDMTLPCSPEQRLLSLLATQTPATQTTHIRNSKILQTVLTLF